MKKKAGLALLGVALVVFLQACKPDTEINPIHEAAVIRALTLKMDPGLTDVEKAGIVQDIYALLQARVEGVKENGYYSKIFNGTSTVAVTQYLDDRISYILSPSMQIDPNISVDGATLPLEPFHATTLALNLGTPLWLLSTTVKPKTLYFKVGGAKVPVLSSRIGIIQLGGMYGYGMMGDYHFSRSQRLSTFVHEGRHSDCTGGVSEEDVARIRMGLFPQGHGCGHLHGNCPTGHALAGIAACDDHPWGAYMVEAVYAGVQAVSCASCTETERQEYKMVALDSLGRHGVEYAKDMLEGRMGDPDMSSSDEITQDANRELLEIFRDLRSESPGETQSELLTVEKQAL